MEKQGRKWCHCENVEILLMITVYLPFLFISYIHISLAWNTMLVYLFPTFLLQ